MLKVISAEVLCLAFSPDGTRLATGSSDFTIRLWAVPSGQELITLHGHSYIINSLSFTADGQTLVSASGDGTVRTWTASPVVENP